MPFALPDWLPHELHTTARELYEQTLATGTADDIELVKRLITHNQMKEVWRELKKRNHSTTDRQWDGSPKTFKHQRFVPSWLQSALPNAAERDQRVAINLFLKRIIHYALMSKPITHRCGPDRRKSLYRKADSLIEHAAEMLQTLTPAEIECIDRQEPLEREEDVFALARAAAVLRREADEIQPDDNKRNKRVVEAFVLSVAMAANNLFLDLLPGTTAAVASVVFQRRIKEGLVRSVCHRWRLRSGGRVPVRESNSSGLED